MAARWTAWWVWAIVAATLVFWGLRLTASSIPVPAEARLVGNEQVARGDVARLLRSGPAAAAPAPAVASRFRVVGVVASARPDESGLVMLAFDEQPPRTFRAGQVVDGDLIVQRIEARRVELGPRGQAATIVLELAPLPVATVATLANAAGGPGAPAAQANPAPPVGLSPPAAPPARPADGEADASPPR